MIYWLYKVLALLPLPIKYGLAWVAAVLLQRVFRYRAKVIDTNLKCLPRAGCGMASRHR